MDVPGQDLVTGMPRTVIIDSGEAGEAVAPYVGSIVRTVRRALEECPPELADDIAERGIVLTGGGSLLKDLALRLREETGLPVMHENTPLNGLFCAAT